jgi:hypothetical protein
MRDIMTIESGQSIEFQSYQGLQRVVRSDIGIYEPLNTLIEWLGEIGYRSSDPPIHGTTAETYQYNKSVRLLDTFLIGSMRNETLRKLIRDSIKHKFPIQILILDPYSSLAQLRVTRISSETTKSLEDHDLTSIAIDKVNLSFHGLLEVLSEEVSAETLKDNEIKIPTTVGKGIKDLNDHLQEIKKIKEKRIVDIEVKFYREQTEVPVYLISRFVAKGLIFPDFPASKNPWLIFVDDKTQPDDIYDNFSKAFDNIWENESSFDPKSIPMPPSPNPDEAFRRVFIVHGRDIGAKDTVVRFLESLELEPIVLVEQTSGGNTVVEKFEKYANVGYAIVLLTPDDLGHLQGKPKEIKSRARQNVVLELGYFMGKLSRKRVCALSKGDVEMPSDYHGVLMEIMDEDGGWKIKLAREMKSAGLAIDLNKIE